LGLSKLPFWKRNEKFGLRSPTACVLALRPVFGGTKLEALRELALAKSSGRAKPSARVNPATLGQGERS